jgi:hypothetical protein
MNLARIMGVALGLLAVLAYGHVFGSASSADILGVRIVSSFLGLHLAECATREIGSIIPELCLARQSTSPRKSAND